MRRAGRARAKALWYAREYYERLHDLSPENVASKPQLAEIVAHGGEWQAVDPAMPPAPATVYGLLLYPEIAFAFDNALSLTARAIVSPVDGSALVVHGVSVSVHRRLTFLGMPSVSIGDETDSWSWTRRDRGLE